MEYLLKPSDVDINTLTILNTQKINLNTAINNLLGGNTVVVKGLEASSGEDTYVRLTVSNPTPVTQITYANPNKKGSYWEPYPVAINVFSLYDVYTYNSVTAEFDSILREGDIIKYRNSDGKMVAVIIDKGYKDKDGKLYYTFTNDNKVYTLVQTGQGMYGEKGDGSKPFIPVEDITKDSSSAILKDNKDSIRVLL